MGVGAAAFLGGLLLNKGIALGSPLWFLAWGGHPVDSFWCLFDYRRDLVKDTTRRRRLSRTKKEERTDTEQTRTGGGMQKR